MDKYHELTLYQTTKFLDVTKLKEFADDKYIVDKIMLLFLLFDGEENIVGKGENANYHHFLLFPQWVSERLINSLSKRKYYY